MPDNPEKKRSEKKAGCSTGCACHAHQINRRDFLALGGAAVLGTLVSARPVMAGPLEASETDAFAALIPPDKKLHPAWVRSLFARGTRTVYTKKRNELTYIGMPVGGLCCGTVYLGGDGRLWVWDIFNENQEGILPRSVTWHGFGGDRTVGARDGAAFVSPHTERAPLDQGFALRVNGVTRSLDAAGWAEIAFTGQYPIGQVEYSDPSCPMTVTLDAYSPFIPLNAEDSSLPVVVCEWTLRNRGVEPVQAEIAGWLENAVLRGVSTDASVRRLNTARTVAGATVVECSAGSAPPSAPRAPRPDILVADFQQPDYGRWTVTGTAFGHGPVRREDVPAYQGDLGGVGDRVVNSHASAPGTDSASRDAATGTLTSPPFLIQRKFLAFYIGGGSDVSQVGLAVQVSGKTIAQAAGSNDNHMRRVALDLSAYHGKEADILIYDHATGAWGNVGVAQIVQTDQPIEAAANSTEANAGTMALMLLGHPGMIKADAEPVSVFDAPETASAQTGMESKLTAGIVTAPLALAPGQSRTVTFALAWHFPNSKLNVKDAADGNYYAKRFPGAVAVAAYLAQNYPRLRHDTKLWRDTWYDSTLPFWFLDRAFANTSILATSTAHRFVSGRFWGWEGVGCCEGTCTHVWHYAQAVGRLFPELERYVREHVDLGVALSPDTGQIGFRGEGTGPAVDGQCGRILGTYREHQMSADAAFLRRVWPNVKKAMDFMIRHDSNNDGLTDGPQENTLDGTWYGKIPWISSLYAAALRACEEMATEMGDTAFAAECGQRFSVSKSAIETQLFNGGYFIQLPDPAHADSLGAYQGCHIDQVLGQSWAWQVNLGRVLDPAMTVSALHSLYKYNFAPDVGRFRAKNTDGRPYALAGDAGLIMVTNPRGLPDPFGVHSWQFGYFNECMTGFEHQAASHMIAEGLVLEGLAVTRAIHDRYHAARRNPYNEIECSDHYSRSMASYGSFVAMCGFAYHGPKGEIAFDPRLTPENFRAPFTAAEGWGTYAQKTIGTRFDATLTIKHGRLRLAKITLTPPVGFAVKSVTAALESSPLPLTYRRMAAGRLEVNLKTPVILRAGQALRLTAADAGETLAG